MTSPYYVEPAGDFSQGLSGIGDILGQTIQQKKLQVAQKEISDAMQKGDTDSLMKLSVKYPQFRQQVADKVKQQTGLNEDEHKQLMLDLYQDPQNAETHTKLIQNLIKQGKDPSHAILMMKMGHENPEQAK